MKKLRTKASPEWTALEVENLNALWESGKPASYIAKEMNRTRNSIIGKSHRLNLYRRVDRAEKSKRDAAAKTRKPQAPTASPKVWVRPRPPSAWIKAESEIVMPAGSKKVSLIHAKEGQCRAIVEYVDGQLAQAVCCGEDVTVNRVTGAPISWCRYHHSIYFTPPKEQRDGGRSVAPNWSPRRVASVQ